MLVAFLAALALVGAQTDDPTPSQQRKPAPDRAQRTKLSAEDEALVKDLAVLENVDLLKDLDLFEDQEQDQGPKDPPERQQ